MSKIVIDLTQYKQNMSDKITPGRYKVRVSDADLVKTRAGDDMVNLYLEVVGGEFAGKVVIDRLVQTPKALFRTVGFMQALGLPTPKKRLSIDLSRWVGRTLEVDIEDGEPYGESRLVNSEVRGYYRVAAQNDAVDAPSDAQGGETEPSDTVTAPAQDDAPTSVSAQQSEQSDDDADTIDLDTIEL